MLVGELLQSRLLRVVRERFRPRLVLASRQTPGAAASSEEPGDGVPLLAGRGLVDGHAAAYVCEHFVCQAPVTTPEELAAAL